MEGNEAEVAAAFDHYLLNGADLGRSHPGSNDFERPQSGSETSHSVALDTAKTQ
jgi:hypothetical protein